MTFEPGNSYWMLSPDQLEEMENLLADFELDYDLASDFSLADDGNYYATMSSVDSDELDFMNEWGLANIFNYKKSTQSTSPV